ncbi:hypothetical protein BDW22DRAFT_1392179 [Trametopsis cervina]|nr:hypothetical protein BDW22DRAFT_1392179 [Trametopsis cervina]
MRLKNVWNYVPVPAKLKLFADRITFSKLTIFYFVFSILHCLIQVVFQVGAFRINENAANFLDSLIVQGNVSQTGFTVLEGNELRWCTSVPNTMDASQCQVIWDGTQSANQAKSAQDNVDPHIVAYPVNATNAQSSTSSISAPLSTVVSVSSASSSSSSVSSSASLSRTTGVLISTSVTPSASASTSSAVSSRSVSSSLSASSSSSVKSSVSPSTTRTVTATATLDSEALETVSKFEPITVTITVKSSPTSTSAGHDDDDEDEDDEDNHVKRDLLDSPHILSAIAVNGTKEVQIVGLPGSPNEEITLPNSCLVALNWPLTRVDNTKREDIVFIGFSFWVLGMSLVALLNESPPHIVASFLTHCLATGWSAFQLVNTQQFHTDFTRLTTRGACGVNLLPKYWTARAQFEIPTLALNVLALLISAVLSWKLMKSFGWQTFKRIGASLTMSHAYRIILIFSIVIQLSAFFVVVAVALWVDQIYNGDIGHLTHEAPVFKGTAVAVLVLMLPWLAIGWISVRREHKVPMIMFLVLSFAYLIGWSSMFLARTFRWTFVEWRFFSLMATASVVLALATFVLGVVCRCNFGKGLSRYLNAQQPLPGDDFEPAYPPSSPTSFSSSYIADKKWGSDEEKIDFPSYDTSIPIPTYAQVVAPPPAHMQNAPRTLGPRFYQTQMGGGMPFDQRTIASSDPSVATKVGDPPLSRHGSGSSQHSIGSMRSMSSDNSQNMRGKRWVIE